MVAIYVSFSAFLLTVKVIYFKGLETGNVELQYSVQRVLSVTGIITKKIIRKANIMYMKKYSLKYLEAPDIWEARLCPYGLMNEP